MLFIKISDCKLHPTKGVMVINSAILLVNSVSIKIVAMAIPFEILSRKGDRVYWSDTPKDKNMVVPFPSCQSLYTYGGWGNMAFYFIEKAGFSIWYSRYNILKRNQFIARGEVPLLEFTLQMENSASYVLQPFSHKIVKNSQFNIFYLPYMDSRADFESGQLISTLDIHCTFEYLETLSAYFPDLVIPFLDKVKSGSPVQIFPDSFYATGFMIYAAQNILELLKQSPANDYLLELNVKTLLSYALTCKYELNSKVKHITLEQLTRINALRNQLNSDFSSIPNLKDMARQAHMSLPMFKTIFKKEVNSSPYHYWFIHRMQEARNRLLKTDEAISQISFDLAFPDVSNFSKAFKKFHGIAPSELRSENLK